MLFISDWCKVMLLSLFSWCSLVGTDWH